MDKFVKALIVFFMAVLLCPPVFAGEKASPPSARNGVRGDATPKVELYTTSWCGYCKRAKAYLRDKGIPFTEYDVEKDPAAAKRFRTINPRGGVPVALIGDQQINGFAPAAYAAALGL